MSFIRKIAFPFMPVYYGITWARNVLYDTGVKTSTSYDFPVIAIGNLSTGGTGKTPMTEYLVNQLKNKYRLAVLSRGYGRVTKGYVLADSASNASSIGDEPFQIFSKFKEAINLAVSEDRRLGIEGLRALSPQPEVIILDDAFQHRKVQAGFYVLLTAYNNLYVDDYILPTGNLREPIEGAKRAHAIIVTKCPENITEIDKETIKRRLKILPHQKLFFSKITYSETMHSKTETRALKELQLQPFTLVTGIADSSSLVQFLTEQNLEFEHLEYGDHHVFSQKDLQDIKQNPFVLTTEKDFMRLTSLSHETLFYLPIVLNIDKADAFNDLIEKFVGR